MTREEQKIFIAEQIEIFGQDCTMGEFLMDMQEALKQEPCEDAISRANALKNLALTNNKDDVYRMIQALPHVTPIQR